MRHVQQFGLVAFVLVAWLVVASTAQAIWVAVPIEILVDEAELIFVGKVTKLEDLEVKEGERPMQAVVIEVSEALKSLPFLGEVKEVRIKQPAPAGIAISTDMRYEVGQESIWLLSKDPKSEFFRVTHPSQIQPLTEQENLTKLIADRDKVEGGTESAGIVARAELVPNPDNPAIQELRVSLKNVSENPLAVCRYAFDQPVKLAWVGPDGERRKSNHYAWLKKSLPMEVAERDFVTLQPGAVRFVSTISGGTGIVFQREAGEDENANILEPGSHRLTAGFTTDNDGSKLEIENAWTGKVAANRLELEIE